MNVESLYRSAGGRAALLLLERLGLFRLSAGFLRTDLSRVLIPGYIRRHRIDMRDFPGQEYGSFADFFARKREKDSFVIDPDVLISPCDSLLSVYPVTDDLLLPMKGSRYRLNDILPDRKEAERFRGGLCLVFRLRASDYHHFCAFDDVTLLNTRALPGRLHSVQPIACEKEPVYRLNRRWWSVLETRSFGRAVQIEVGAMMVGGVRFEKECGLLFRGDEMGHFELAGSTVLLLLGAEIRNRLSFFAPFQKTLGGVHEVPAAMGEGIGVLHAGP